MGSLLELGEFEAAPLPAAGGRRMGSAAALMQPHSDLGYVHVVPRSVRPRPQGEIESEITGGDDSRGPVMDTAPIPYRFVCWLDLDFGVINGNQVTVRGSGTLISPRHVLTAGHNLFNVFGGVARTVVRVRVGPGFNCLAKRGDIFGLATSLRTRVSDEWQNTRNRQFDYGVITLRSPIGSSTPAALGGKTLGWWGNKDDGGDTRINPTPVARLAGLHVNTSGYPRDKCCVRGISLTQQCHSNSALAPCQPHLWATVAFRSFGRITDASPAAAPRLMFYDLDTCPGHSGGPIWTTWRDDSSGVTYRNLVAIHTGAARTIVPALANVANRGVRITEEVMTDVRRLMRAP